MSTPEKEPIPREFIDWAKGKALKAYEASSYHKPTGKTMWLKSANAMAVAAYRHLSSRPSPGLPWVKASKRQPLPGKYPVRYWGDKFGEGEYHGEGWWVEAHSGTISSDQLEWLDETPSVQPIADKEEPGYVESQRLIPMTENDPAKVDAYMRQLVREAHKELAAAQTELSTQAIQIAGLLASNKGWGEKYVEIEKEMLDYRDLLIFIRDQ